MTAKTEVREHVKTVEVEADFGYRFWAKPMPASEVDAYIARMPADEYVSDVDCSTSCWCVTEDTYGEFPSLEA